MQQTTRSHPRDHATSPADGVVKGASRGFTVLLVGGAVQPLVGATFPPAGYVWLALTAAIAFAWSASVATRAGAPIVHGVLAALGAYLLVLPVVAMGGGLQPMQISFTTLLAVVVSFVAGSVQHARPATAGQAVR